METLNDSLILSESEIDTLNLFDTDDDNDSVNEGNNDDKKSENQQKDSKDTSTENDVDIENLFDSESVGSKEEKEDDTKRKGETPSSQKDGSSPDNNFYYSIANALVEDGVLSDLDESFIKNIKSPEDLAEAIDKQVTARLDETQKRINDALNANVDTDEIRQYETVLGNLENISDDVLKDETQKGETLRKQLIYQDFINRGFSKDRALREIKKSFDSGSDIEDAKDALENNKSFFRQQYENLIKEGQEEVERNKQKVKEEAEALKKQMLEDKEVFKGINIDKSVRQKAYDNVTKAVYKTEDGEYLTAVQKYALDNPVEFRKKLGVLFTLTNGFKDIDNLVKGNVRKEVKKSLRELEHTLRNTSRPTGNLKFIDGEDDLESYSSDWSIDV